MITQSNRQLLIQWYYLATPIFFLIDFILGSNIRAWFLTHTSVRIVYYVFCFACGILIYYFPKKTNLIGLIESSTNILLLLASFGMIYYDSTMNIANIWQHANIGKPLPLTLTAAINFAIAVSIWTFCYYQNPLIKTNLNNEGTQL